MHPEGRSWMSPALLPASRHPWITWFEAKSATNSWKSRHHEIGEGSFISWTYLESRPSGRHLLGLAHELAAVDLDDLAYQVVGPRRGQEQHRPCYLLGRTLAAYWDDGRHVLAHVGWGEAIVEGGGDDAGGHAVHQDVLRDELLGHRAGEGADAPLGRRVGRRAGPAAVAGGDGGHVDDPAAPLPLHHGQDRLRAEVDRLQVHANDAVPEVLGHLREAAAFDQGPRVVDQDVEAPVAVLDLVRHPLDLTGVRHVAPDEHRIAARSRDLLHHLPRLVSISARRLPPVGSLSARWCASPLCSARECYCCKAVS